MSGKYILNAIIILALIFVGFSNAIAYQCNISEYTDGHMGISYHDDNKVITIHIPKSSTQALQLNKILKSYINVYKTELDSQSHN